MAAELIVPEVGVTLPRPKKQKAVSVRRIARLLFVAEYKRRQAAPGVRITSRAFGRDWRYPITSGYKPG